MKKALEKRIKKNTCFNTTSQAKIGMAQPKEE